MGLFDTAALTIARTVAATVHRDDVDKQGRSYLDHHLAPVARLARSIAQAAGLPDETVALIEAVAWLHDSIEDHGLTADDFDRWGIPEVYPHVLRLSHDKSTPYQLYIVGLCATNDVIAIIVKLADNIVNQSTLDALDAATRERLTAKYEMAFRLLFAALSAILAPLPERT